MITLIARPTIHDFQLIVPGLERAMGKTDIGSFWDIDSVYRQIVNEQAFGFLQHESGYGGVFTINNTPLARILYHFWGGKPDNDVAPDWSELDAFLNAAATVFGCSHIQCEGRKGWKPLLAPLGYVEDSVTYMKKVIYESVPIQPVDPVGGESLMADQEANLWKGGSSSTSSKSTTTSTPMQTDEYKNLLSGANSWLNSGGFDDNYGGSEGYDSVADQTAGQTAGLSGLNSTGSNLQSILDGSGMSSLTRYLGDYDPNNTGLTAAMDASNSNLDWNYGTQVAPQLRQGATNAGQYGSTRAGVAEGIAQSQLSQQKVNANSTLAYNDQQAYNSNQLNALTNLSTIAKGLGSGSAMQYDAGTLQQTQNQNEINGQLQAWAYENNVDLNDLLAYQSLISGDYGGTTTSKSTNTSSGGSSTSALGSLAGTVAGAYVGGPVGASVGSQAGGLLFG